jgi:dihydrofolate reductase (trimethoprim resistance protein)
MSWPRTHTKFALGDRVQKDRGSSWHGRVVGWYSTSLTSEGYCVESFREPGSVQIYPAAALRRVYEPDLECLRNEDPLT